MIKKRKISDEIIKYLDTDNIIVLHGARQVGKTSIMYFLREYLQEQNRITYFFDLEDQRYLDLLNGGADSLMRYLKSEGLNLPDDQNTNTGSKQIFLFIDEIQYLENPSPLLKILADHHKYLQVIASGSSSFDIKTKFSDSLVGRTVEFEIFGLSFQEFLEFKQVNIDSSKPLSSIHLEKLQNLYSEFVLYGCYPKIVLEDSASKKEKYLQQIIDTYVKKDVRDLARIENIGKFNNLLKVLASQSGQLLNIGELGDTCHLARQTVEHYLSILENTYVIKLVTPFSTSAKVEIVKTPKVFFYDTGLLQMLWLKNLQGTILGPMFETSVFAELCKKYEPDSLHFWRTKSGSEIDFVIDAKGTILPIEVKESFRKFTIRAVETFCKKYRVSKYQMIGLRGNKTGRNFLYPWEI